MRKCVKEIGMCCIAVDLTHPHKTHWIICSAGKTAEKTDSVGW